MKDTFSRLVAFSFRWARGERAHRLTSVLAGLVPDMIADGARQVMRGLLPLDLTMPDFLPSQLRRFGLPPYMPNVVGYFAQLARLQNVLDTQSRAGSTDQLTSELTIIGIPDGAIEPSDDGFWVTSSDLIPAPDFGWTIGDEICLGGGAGSVAQTRSVCQCLEYFKPAADKFEGFKAP